MKANIINLKSKDVICFKENHLCDIFNTMELSNIYFTRDGITLEGLFTITWKKI